MNLREALNPDLIGFDGQGNVTLPQEAFEAVHAAARRFLALTETGPEKRWCVKHDCEGLGNAGEIGCTGAGVGRVEDMDCRLIPVYLIPADYLTEEE